MAVFATYQICREDKFTKFVKLFIFNVTLITASDESIAVNILKLVSKTDKPHLCIAHCDTQLPTTALLYLKQGAVFLPASGKLQSAAAANTTLLSFFYATYMNIETLF